MYRQAGDTVKASAGSRLSASWRVNRRKFVSNCLKLPHLVAEDISYLIDTKSSGIRGRWDLEPVDYEYVALRGKATAEPASVRQRGAGSPPATEGTGEDGAVGEGQGDRFVEGQRPVRWPVRVSLGGRRLTVDRTIFEFEFAT